MPTVTVWAPQTGPQKALIDCPLPEVFFGGTRGGGKTDGVLGKWALKEQRYGQKFNAVMFRRTTVSAEDAIERSKEIYEPLGGKFSEQRLRWRMPNGGRVSFRYLENVTDADHWQGRNVTDAWVEEVGQYPHPAPVDRINGILRSADGVPTQLVLTGNPGGAGQHWIADRYKLIPFAKQPYWLERKLPNGEIHEVAVIPSRIGDNRILLDSDPGYINRLHLVGNEQLVKAWLEGDWSAIEGAFFDTWSEAKHVIEPRELPEHWTRFRSMDWGFAAPFSVGWWAVAGEDFDIGKGRPAPKGSLIRYREWYGSEKPGEGIRMDAEQVALGIKEREDGEEIAGGVLDPAAWGTQSGPSPAERIITNGVLFRKADNRKIAKIGALGGWDQMRARLRGNEDGEPLIYCFSTCRASIRTIPVLQHDPIKAEDLDTDQEDHAADEWRYACMSRPITTTRQTKPVATQRYLATIEQLNRQEERRQRNETMRYL